jgi:DNA-binding NtrC family response regulator
MDQPGEAPKSNRPPKRALLAGSDPATRDTLAACLAPDYSLAWAPTATAALDILRLNRHEFVFAHLPLLLECAPKDAPGQMLAPFKALYPAMDVIVLASQEMARETVLAEKAGAAGHLLYPVRPELARHLVEKLRSHAAARSELAYLRGEFWEKDALDVVQTQSPLMCRVFENIRSVAPTRSTVLLIGETGVGKGVLARLIHRHSSRRNGPFIAVHCGAIPDTLLESELFGHEKGAFTGAARRKLGRFEIAKGGTIFLDEIATLTPGAQVKLLQVLQDGCFTRVGGEQAIEGDVRIIAATNMDLQALAREGGFRKDLFYRLNVFPIQVPPLSERIEDAEQFALFFLRALERQYGKGITEIDPLVIEALQLYDWPGNIRELENLVERAYILESGTALSPENFPAELFVYVPQSGPLAMDPAGPEPTLAQHRQRTLIAAEREYLHGVLSRHQGKINEAAKAAGITARQLHKLMARHGLKKEQFRGVRAP